MIIIRCLKALFYGVDGITWVDTYMGGELIWQGAPITFKIGDQVLDLSAAIDEGWVELFDGLYELEQLEQRRAF